MELVTCNLKLKTYYRRKIKIFEGASHFVLVKSNRLILIFISPWAVRAASFHILLLYCFVHEWNNPEKYLVCNITLLTQKRLHLEIFCQIFKNFLLLLLLMMMIMMMMMMMMMLMIRFSSLEMLKTLRIWWSRTLFETVEGCYPVFTTNTHWCDSIKNRY